MNEAAPPPAPPVRLLSDLIDFAAARAGDAPFVCANRNGAWEAVTYRAAAESVHAFALLLQRAGVRSGTRVGLIGTSRPEWGLAWLAILECGAIVVPVDPLLGPAEVAAILSAAATTHAVAGHRQIASLVAARAALPGLVLLSFDAGDGVASFADAVQRPAGERVEPVAGDPGNLATLIFTSGTSGKPKGVMLTHANLLSNVEACIAAFRFTGSDRFLSVLPIHHAFELTAGFLSPLRSGASVWYARGLKPKELLEDLADSRATVLLGVPILYERMVQGFQRALAEGPAARRLFARGLLAIAATARAAGIDVRRPLLRPLRRALALDGLRLMVSGAAPLAPPVFDALAELGVELLEGYGLTECSPVVSANRPGRAVRGSVGPPLPGVEVRIDAPDETGSGEFQVRGPNVMKGYLDDPGATAQVLREGWLATGDLGRLDHGGALFVTGRLKNMIATAGGKKVYPEEVEALLSTSGLVREVLVIAGRDSEGHEEVHAHVFPDLAAAAALARDSGVACDRAFLEDAVRREVERQVAALAPFKRPRRVFVHERELPRTSTGKILRRIP